MKKLATDTGRKDIFAIPNSTRSLDGLLHAHSSLSDFLPDKFRRGLRTPRSVINEFQDTGALVSFFRVSLLNISLVLHSKVSEMDCEQIEQILNLKSCDINARDPKKKATALVLATSLENEEKSLKICKVYGLLYVPSVINRYMTLVAGSAWCIHQYG